VKQCLFQSGANIQYILSAFFGGLTTIDLFIITDEGKL
jgi:hypothetical protein